MAILPWSGSANAQVTSDGTTNTIVNASGNNFNILNGTEKGNNLFHSFSNFSVTTGGSATFDLTNTPNITTIFSRVTGGNISKIDGLIRTLNGSNPVSLFLMNPNGIMFGQNASLNIGGSFVGTTANSIKFADGTEFSAVNASSPPLLTMSVPIGLQMGQNSKGITVQNTGHRLINGIFTSTDRSQSPVGLQVNGGNTLALIGGEVNLSGGLVTTNGGGHLEVGGVSDGQVGLKATPTGWVGDYSSVRQFQDVHLTQQSLLDASGANGSIQVHGQNISLSEGSAILLQNLGSQASGGITVKAAGSLNLTGTVRDGSFASNIKIDNLGSGQVGDIAISAKQVSIQDGGNIITGMFTPASGGNIIATVADSILLDGFNPTSPANPSSIYTTTFNSANAGNITLSTGNLRLLRRGILSSISFGTGKTGNIRVQAQDLIEVGEYIPSQIVSPSGILLASTALGDTGDLLINTARLVIRDGGVVGAIVAGKGASGNVIINASDSVDVQGRQVDSILPSRIIASAEILDAATQKAYGLPPIPSGDSGSLIINTPSLRITDGAYIAVKNDGSGRAGDIQIHANSIFLDNQGSILASTASGNGGDVRLNLQNSLLLRHNSSISATAELNGNGGNLTINSPVIVGLENSDIVANAVEGNGGNIQIATQGIFGLKYSGQLTDDSDITASSKFGVDGTVDINNFGVDPSSGLVELPGELTDSSQQISTGCSTKEDSSFVSTGRGGIPQNPTKEIGSDVYDGLRLRPWSDTRDISAYRKTGEITAQISPSPEVLVQATSWRRNAQGKIELVAAQPSTSMQPSLTCAAIPKS